MSRPTRPQRSMQPSTRATLSPEQPSYEHVAQMLTAAQNDVKISYAHLPRLRDELEQQFQDGISECQTRERGPLGLLRARLRGERLAFDAWNKHRLNQVAFRYYKDVPAPDDAEALLESVGDNIEEDLENFPLRFQVVDGGFPALTEDLPPIYQAAEHAARLAAKAPSPSQVPATPSKHTPKSTKPGTPSNYDKLQDSPAPNLDFPVGNITLAEAAAFNPQSLKSWDMVDRFCGNGGSQATFAVMINHFRSMSLGPITANSVYRLFKAPMTLRAKVENTRYEGWTTGIHLDQFHDADNFDPTSVSVTGFRTAANGKIRTSAPPIPIKDMANGVKNFPAGDDALDLTRAVQYCQKHPEEDWMYPTDFERLVKEKLGGPAKVKPGHYDSAIIARYTSNRIAVGVRNNKSRKRDSRGRLQKVEFDEEEDIDMTDSEDGSDDDVDFDALDKKGSKRKTVFDDSDSDEYETPSRKPQAKRAKITPKPRAARGTPRRAPGPSRLRLSFLAGDIDSDSDDAYQGPKKNKAVASVRRSSRKTKVTQTYDVNTFGKFDDEEEDVTRRYDDSNSDEDMFEEED